MVDVEAQMQQIGQRTCLEQVYCTDTPACVSRGGIRCFGCMHPHTYMKVGPKSVGPTLM